MSRTVLLTRRFPPETCGVGDYSLRLAESLSRQGEQVTLITGPGAGVRPREFRVLEMPMSTWRDLEPLLQAIRAEHPDRVQLEYSAYGWSRWGFSFWLNALAFSLRRRGLSMALALHEVPIRMRQHPLQVPIALIQWLHTALLIVSARRVAVNLPERVTLLRRLFFWRGSTIFYRPNSATIPVVPQSAERRRGLRELRGVQPGETVVATFGMFQAGKNLEGVIDAVTLLRRERSVKLWLLGDSRSAKPSYIAGLRERARKGGIESNVFWSGYLEAAQVSAHLHAADLFVLPQPDGHLTRSSAFMAAAAHGLPVVAVRNTRNQAEFLDGRDVFLAESGDPVQLAAAIDDCLCDPDTAREVGANLKRLYQEKFDWPVGAAAFNSELFGACSTTAAPPAGALRNAPSTKARGEA